METANLGYSHVNQEPYQPGGSVLKDTNPIKKEEKKTKKLSKKKSSTKHTATRLFGCF